MNFEGTQEIKASRQQVWDFVTNPNNLARCLPDLKSLEVEGQDKFNAVVRAGIGFIKGDFKFKLALLDKIPPSHARLAGTGTGAGSSVDLDALMDLTEVDGHTKLTYKAVVKVGGAMATVAQNMFQRKAEGIVTDVFSSVRANVEK